MIIKKIISTQLNPKDILFWNPATYLLWGLALVLLSEQILSAGGRIGDVFCAYNKEQIQKNKEKQHKQYLWSLLQECHKKSFNRKLKLSYMLFEPAFMK